MDEQVAEETSSGAKFLFGLQERRDMQNTWTSTSSLIENCKNVSLPKLRVMGGKN